MRLKQYLSPVLVKWKDTRRPVRWTVDGNPSGSGPWEFSERSIILLAVLFLAMAAGIYHLLHSTLIPLLDASRWYILFGLIGFVVAFLFRKKAQLSLLDGFYFNVFIIAPFCLLLFLSFNRMHRSTYTETYRITSFQSNGDSYVLELENDAYEEFWRIRNIPLEPSPAGKRTVQFVFSDGAFGYKVLHDVKFP